MCKLICNINDFTARLMDGSTDGCLRSELPSDIRLPDSGADLRSLDVSHKSPVEH